MTVAAHTVASVARRVASDYLGLTTGERFVIVVDTRTDREIPEALAAAASDLGAEAAVVTIEPLARSGAEPPSDAALAMRTADAVLCAASTSLYLSLIHI